MITSLSIKNLALIENITVSFNHGFSVFTGETGAGKSILLGAIGLLLGDRASTESIRSGFDEAEIHATFELNHVSSGLKKLLDEAALDISENLLIIRRTIQKEGRNRIFINQIPVPLATLKQIGDHLIDLHGQHDHQLLLRPESADEIINTMSSIKPVFAKYSEAFVKYRADSDAYNSFRKNADSLIAQKELLEFQFNEIKKLSLTEGEEESLENEYRLLSTKSERIESAQAIIDTLNGGENEDSISRKISSIESELKSMAKNDDSANPWIDQIDSIYTFLSELENYASSYLSESDGDSDIARLDLINSRIASIQRLKKKHQTDFAGLLEKARSLKKNLDSIENRDAELEFLKKQAEKSKTACIESAKVLTNAKTSASEKFDSQITAEMNKLGFVNGAIKTVFNVCNDLTSNGLENAEFTVRTNPGEPFRPLAKTASGGEISRIMLAMKTVLSSADGVPVLIFDEIDTGIGGRLALDVADALYALSRSYQVLCISHLHQIASRADFHFSVYKQEESGRTKTHIQLLDKEERILEISRMLGRDSDTAKKHAQELLERS